MQVADRGADIAPIATCAITGVSAGRGERQLARSNIARARHAGTEYNSDHKGKSQTRGVCASHEALHGYGGSGTYDDDGLMAIFGLDPTGPSSQISDYIKSHCF